MRGSVYKTGPRMFFAQRACPAGKEGAKKGAVDVPLCGEKGPVSGLPLYFVPLAWYTESGAGHLRRRQEKGAGNVPKGNRLFGAPAGIQWEE